MRPGKIVVLIIGVLIAVVSLALLAGGGVALWAHGTQRDTDGWYATSAERLATPTHALISRPVVLEVGPGGDWFFERVDFRIRAESTDAAPVFVGIGPAAEVDAYLAGVAHDEVSETTGVWFEFQPEYRRIEGTGEPADPATQGFWVASADGPGLQTAEWDGRSGSWKVVVMRADAAPGLDVDISVGAQTGLLLPVGIGALVAGLLFALGAAALIVVAVRRRPAVTEAPVRVGEGPPLVTEGAYPVRVEASLDAPLSRGLWLVKWFLAIPHLLILAFLWVAFGVLTIVAWFAILFTGRYPRGMFDFNVGVLRWSWRVTYYAFTLGTDRYPPFSLDPDPSYPASFDVAYPERLSRGLVLVKWWLLAIPHYVVIALFTSGFAWWQWGGGHEANGMGGVGLVGILVFVAAVILLFTGRYPDGIHSFVIGMNRWILRVTAYATLMRDEYPPFRLDLGGRDPAGSVDAPATSSPPPSR